MTDYRTFGLREFSFPATTLRDVAHIPVTGYGIAVVAAPATAAPELRIGSQDTDPLPLRPGMSLRTPAPFNRLYLSNAAAAAGTIRFVVATEPDAAVLLGGVGDVTMGGVTPAMGRDDTEAQAGAASGVLNVVGRNYAWNGATWDRLRSKWEVVALASASRSATTASALINTYNAKYAYLRFRISAVPGVDTVTLSLWGIINTSWSYSLLLDTARSGTAQVLGMIGPGVTDVAGRVDLQNDVPLPAQIMVNVAHSGVGAFIYEAQVQLIS